MLEETSNEVCVCRWVENVILTHFSKCTPSSVRGKYSVKLQLHEHINDLHVLVHNDK